MKKLLFTILMVFLLAVTVASAFSLPLNTQMHPELSTHSRVASSDVARYTPSVKDSTYTNQLTGVPINPDVKVNPNTVVEMPGHIPAMPVPTSTDVMEPDRDGLREVVKKGVTHTAVEVSVKNYRPSVYPDNIIYVVGKATSYSRVYDVTATVTVEGTSLEASVEMDELKQGEEFSVVLYDKMPADIQPGVYDVVFTVKYNDDSTLRVSKEVTAKTSVEVVAVQTSNHAPVLGSIGSKTVNADNTVTFTVSATDSDNDELTYSVEGMPSGATLTDRTFSWTPTNSQAGNHQMTFKVSDGSAEDSEIVTVTVTSRDMTDAEKVNELEDQFNNYEDDYKNLKNDLEDARDDEDQDEEENVLDDLDDLKKDLNDLKDDINDLQDEVTDNDAEDDLDNLEDDVKDLITKVKNTINGDDSTGSADSYYSTSDDYKPAVTTKTQPQTTHEVYVNQAPQTNTDNTVAKTKFTETSTYTALLISVLVLLGGLALFLVMFLVKMFE